MTFYLNDAYSNGFSLWTRLWLVLLVLLIVSLRIFGLATDFLIALFLCALASRPLAWLQGRSLIVILSLSRERVDRIWLSIKYTRLKIHSLCCCVCLSKYKLIWWYFRSCLCLRFSNLIGVLCFIRSFWISIARLLCGGGNTICLSDILSNLLWCEWESILRSWVLMPLAENVVWAVWVGNVEYVVAILAVLCLLAMALGKIWMVQEVLSTSIHRILCRHWDLNLCCLRALWKWIAKAKRIWWVALARNTLLIHTAWKTISPWLIYLLVRWVECI